MIIKQIKKEQLEARKAKNTIKTNLYTTLLGEVQTAVIGTPGSVSTKQANNIADDIVIKVINKFIKNIKETLSLRPDDFTANTELTLLETFLPQKLSEEELKQIVANLKIAAGTKTGGALLGFVMGELKKGYPNLYDASIVRTLVESS